MPGFLPQHERRHDAAGGVAAIAQHLRQQPLAGFDGEPDVVAHAGFERQAAREQRGVRRQRLRRVRVRALEDHAVGGERVDRGRPHVLVSVGGQMIGPQRVDRNDDDRAADRRRCARVAPSADRGEQRPQRGQKEDEGEAKRTRH